MSKIAVSKDSQPYNILRLSIIDSTNVFAKTSFEELRDRTIIVADNQTAGKGRVGRSWLSRDGNLFMTLVLKPNTHFSRESGHSCLTHYIGVCLCLLLERMGLKPGLKWPNDIQVEKKKIAGILAESIPLSKRTMGIILGIGVNLNLLDSDLESIDQPAISLTQLLPPAKRPSRDIFMKELLDIFFERYDLFLKKGFPVIAETYNSFLLYRDCPIRLETEQYTLHGTVRGVNANGALLLVNEENKLIEYFAGDIWPDTSAPN